MRQEILQKKLVEFVAPSMRRRGVGQWLILTREGTRDAIADHFHAGSVVGRTAISIRPTPHGAALRAVCASYDRAPLEDCALYDSITSYGPEGWSDALHALVVEEPGSTIAVNTSADEPLGDGLTVALHRELSSALGEGGIARLVSSEPLLHELFSRKTEWEIDRIRVAAERAESILRRALSAGWVRPGQTTERQLADRIIEEVAREGVGLAWERLLCPSVQTGTTRGHAASGDRTIRRGDLVAVDFGVAQDGYVSDLQRTLFAGSRAEVPPELHALWETTRAAVGAATKILRPGVTGLEVDGAARSIVHRGGYTDYIHATGHPIGYVVHDVGPMLGPNWPGRYGNRVHQELTRDMVFAVEPAAAIEREDGLVRMGLEEDVVVRETGAEFLAPPQVDLWTLEP